MTLEAFRRDRRARSAPARRRSSRALERIAAPARAAGLPMASHDDDTPAIRDAFRARGARICEFPMTEAVARAAAAAGDCVAMGSPNVVRGRSHLGWASAAALAEAGICRVLTSDYFYPCLLGAPFVLAAARRAGFRRGLGAGLGQRRGRGRPVRPRPARAGQAGRSGAGG